MTEKVSLEVPAHLATAIGIVVATFEEKSASYGNADDWDGMFESQASHLGVPRWVIADIQELTKLSRIRSMRLQSEPREAWQEQYRDKATFALIALALFLDHFDRQFPIPPQAEVDAARERLTAGRATPADRVEESHEEF
jgi:hypothetical protein